MTPILKLGMEDVGTRLEFLSDLHELWGWTLGVLTAGTYHTQFEIEQAEELEVALRLLENFMLIGYSPTAYAKTINNLPSDAKEIKDEPKRNNPRK